LKLKLIGFERMLVLKKHFQ